MLRFTLSPTEDIHIGNLKVALLNYIVAKQRGEKFLVRIEDTDVKKNIDANDREILEILTLFGIEFDEVVYQSHNQKFHQQLAMKLLMDKNAYNCFCSSEHLNMKKQEAKDSKKPYRYDEACKNLPDELVIDNENPFSVRISKPKDDLKFTDLIKGDMSFKTENIDDFVILRVDKTPTYNFASALDDMLSDISLVIREDDYISNTHKETAIRDAIGYDKTIEYAHLPIILNNASSVKWLLEEGFLPEAIANYLLLIGFKAPQEIFSIEDAIEWYDITKVSKSPVKFDMTELKNINKSHILAMDSLKLASLIGHRSSEIGDLAKLYTEEASTINELKEKIEKIFTKKECDEFAKEFETLKLVIKDAPHFNEYDEFEKYLMEKSGLKGKQLFEPLRVLLTGAKSGPNVSDIYRHIKNYIKEVAK